MPITANVAKAIVADPAKNAARNAARRAAYAAKKAAAALAKDAAPAVARDATAVAKAPIAAFVTPLAAVKPPTQSQVIAAEMRKWAGKLEVGAKDAWGSFWSGASKLYNKADAAFGAWVDRVQATGHLSGH